MRQVVATPGAKPHTRRKAGLWLIGFSAILAGCAVQQAEVSPEGVLEVINPAMAAAGDGSDGDWISILDDGASREADQLRITMQQGQPVARAIARQNAYRIVRRVNANLLVSPFLSWQWRVSRHRGAFHPVRLVVGFYGGDRRFGSRGAQPFVFLGEKLPPHDRSIEIVWGAQALSRGNLSKGETAAQYTARGGTIGTDRWWSESLDLTNLYRRLWPKDELPRVHVAFLGIAVGSSTDVELAEIKELALHR